MNNKFHIIEFDTINSSNTYLKENYETLDDLTVCVCKHQTHGKGRSGNVWVDDMGSLLFSVLIKSQDVISKININIIPVLASIAVSKAVESISKSKTMIKWPNDIIINDKKITGILLESVVTDKIEALVIGIGMNINNERINQDLIYKASSLKLLTNNTYDIKKILSDVLSNLSLLINQRTTLTKEELDYYNERNYLYGKEVTFIYNGVNTSGVCGLINELGELEIRKDEDVIKLYYGEVSLKGVYK